MRVRWLTRALLGLEAEANYIGRDNPAAAARTVQKIEVAVQQLQRYPALGRPGRVTGTRELIVPGTPYLIPYKIIDEEIVVLRVFHTSRKWPPEE